MVQMGVFQTSKNQALLMSNSTNAQAKGKHKGKDPKAYDSKPKENQKSFKGALGSKKKKKFEILDVHTVCEDFIQKYSA